MERLRTKEREREEEMGVGVGKEWRFGQEWEVEIGEDGKEGENKNRGRWERRRE